MKKIILGVVVKGTIVIENIKNWKNDQEIIEHCNHIISHSERYEKERVFEAKTLLQRLK